MTHFMSSLSKHVWREHLNIWINTSLLLYLRVSVSEERPVVDVGAAADDEAVVNDEKLGVDVDQLGHRRVEQRRVGAQRAEASDKISL